MKVYRAIFCRNTHQINFIAKLECDMNSWVKDGWSVDQIVPIAAHARDYRIDDKVLIVFVREEPSTERKAAE